MGFALLFNLLSPLLVAALKILLPWIIERVTDDIKAGRPTEIDESDIRFHLAAKKDAIRAAYKGGRE